MQYESNYGSPLSGRCAAFLRRGQWDRSESYFNEAERLDPRNVSLLSQHANSYICRRHFPEALRKLDQILDIMPEDVDALVAKASMAQAEGDLPRASALLALNTVRTFSVAARKSWIRTLPPRPWS